MSALTALFIFAGYGFMWLAILTLKLTTKRRRR
jgi:hypothetical protein